jgi:gamma-glutamyltranspeptidase/glutathione hydrolase
MRIMLMRKFILIMLLLVSSPAVWAGHGMVVTEQQLASQVGIDILKAGGNAVDAAVAVGYALAVVNPCCGNIGGGGFMLIRWNNGKTIFINFRERAPLAATPAMFANISNTTTGYLAVAVPGTVLGLETALKKYGTMTRQQVMAPAIKLAEQGFVLRPGDDKFLFHFTEAFRAQPNVAAVFLNKQQQSYAFGGRLIQKQLAITLKKIAKQGSDVFYKGSIAEEVVAASKAHGGVLSLKDFATYYVDELVPINCNYRGYHIITAPPPSAGGITLCEMLNILENYPLSTLGFHSAQSVHVTTEAMRYAFFDRNNSLGDPKFVTNPVTHLLSKKYAFSLYRKIKPNKAMPSDELGNMLQVDEKKNTTHYSIVDNAGNAVAVTYTLNGIFGAKVIAGNTGFFLNNEMDDFTVRLGKANKFKLKQGSKNMIQAGKQPLSSMTPTIITYHHKLFMVVGSPGGPRIITTVLQTILNVLDYGMTMQAAVDAPRFHHQCLPDSIDIEPDVFSKITMDQLAAMGYQFSPQETWSAAEAIYIEPSTGKLFGGSDYRRAAGKAIGD